MKNILNIFFLEFKNVFKDPGASLIIIGGFFLYGLFYTVPFSTDILKDAPIAIVDLDNSKMSLKLARDIDSSQFVSVKYKLNNINKAKELFAKSKILSYVLIPKDFQKNILNGSNSTIVSFEDSAYVIIYKQIATGITTSVLNFAGTIETGALMKQGIPKKTAISLKVPFNFIQNPLYNPIGSYQNYVFPLVMVLILQQTLFVGTGLLMGVLRERMEGYKTYVNGKIKRLKKEVFNKISTNPVEIVLGKALAYFSIYFVYAIICLYIFPPFVNYKLNYNIISCMLILIPFLISISFLTQAFIVFYKKREHVMFIMVPLSVPFIFLAGFIWPKDSMPYFVHFIANIIPSNPAIDGLIRINQMGANFYMVQEDFYILLALCIIYFICAILATKKIMNKNSKI